MRFVKRSLLAAGALMLGGIAVLTVIGMIGIGTADASTVEGGEGVAATPYQTALAAQLGISVDQLQAAQQSAMNDNVDQAVNAGTITSDQGSKLKGVAFKGGQHAAKHGRFRTLVGRVVDSAAKTIGITPKETRQDLRSGQSLAQIAAAHNMSRDQLKAGMSTDLTNSINTALTGGKITQQQATKLQGGLNNRLDRAIDRTGRHHK